MNIKNKKQAKFFLEKKIKILEEQLDLAKKYNADNTEQIQSDLNGLLRRKKSIEEG